MCNITICDEKDVPGLIDLLKDVEQYLPCKLSDRVSLDEYVVKVLTYGYILAVRDCESIRGAILFYCNKKIDKTAYITMLGVRNQYNNRGYGGMLINKMEEYSINNGMERVELDTNIQNKNAISFYIKKGYSIIQEKTFGLEIKYLMRKVLK
jgi:ribosomal protein S18 acetylase RimI-like enzyme